MAHPPDPQGRACSQLSLASQLPRPLPGGSAPPPAALCPACRGSSDSRAAWQVIDGTLPAAGKTLLGKPFLYPPNPPVSAFQRGWSISPGRSWCWKMPKCPALSTAEPQGLAHSLAPSWLPGRVDDHAGCRHGSQTSGSQPPSAFGFFQQHQSPPLHAPGLQIGSTLLQMVSQLKPSFFFHPSRETWTIRLPSQKRGLGQNSIPVEWLRDKGHISLSSPTLVPQGWVQSGQCDTATHPGPEGLRAVGCLGEIIHTRKEKLFQGISVVFQAHRGAQERMDLHRSGEKEKLLC